MAAAEASALFGIMFRLEWAAARTDHAFDDGSTGGWAARPAAWCRKYAISGVHKSIPDLSPEI